MRDLDALLRRGVAEIIVEEEFRRLLLSGRSLRFKLGLDPSCPDIHLGHAVVLRKLRRFQEMGHKVILIIGDWTAQIGDPTGAQATRPVLSRDEVLANARTYLDQFFKIVDPERTEIRWQSEWYDRFTLSDMISLARKFTVAQLLSREDFAERMKAGRQITLSELIYPILQAYDSVVVRADVECGGIDQKFNCLMGRELQRMMGVPPQQILLTPLLRGLDGKRKMSKSLGNYIGIADPPEEMYGKVMSIPDELIMEYFELLTDVPEEELSEMEEDLKRRRKNPMELKKRLAFEITSQFHSEEAARRAQEHFERVFQRRELPAEAPSFALAASRLEEKPSSLLVSILVESGLAGSRSEAKRLIRDGAVEIDGVKISQDRMPPLRDGALIKVGKHRFLKLEITE